MKKNLISMTDFVLEQKEVYVNDRETKANVGLHNYLRITSNYAKLLKQTLELWMFIPCKLVDDVWMVLEEPTIDGFDLNDMYDWNLYDEDCQEYQQAKERCLFDVESFNKNIIKSTSFYEYRFIFTNGNYFDFEEDVSYTIENIVKYNPQLTPTAQKQIEL